MKDKKLIYDLFSICDKYIEIENFVEFESEFAEVVKRAGMNFYQIYYNESFDNLKKKYKRYDTIQKEEYAINHS